jgi:hypothetical protein
MGIRLIVLLMTLAVTTTGCGATREAVGRSPLLSFEPRDGWFTAEKEERPDPQGEALAVAWAANVPFVDDRAESAWPDPTIRTLPAKGIVLEAVGPWLYTGDEDVPPLKVPLTLADGYCLADGYEGQPAPNVSFCAIAARIGGKVMNAYAYFGRNEPTSEMKADANEMLATLAISG